MMGNLCRSYLPWWIVVPYLLTLNHLSGCSGKREKIQNHAERGLEAIKAGRYDIALDEYREALRLDPENAACYHAMGFLYASRRQFDRAESAYRKVVDLELDYAEAYNDLGCLEIYRTTQYARGFSLFERAIQKAPDEPLFRVNMGNVLLHLGRYTEAARAFQEALHLDPANAHALIGLGEVAVKQGDYQQATQHYTEALKIKEKDTDIHKGLGLVYAKQGNYDEAIRHYRTAIAIDPSDAKAHFGLGDLLIKTGHPSEGEREMQIFRALGQRKLEAGRLILANPAKMKARQSSTLTTGPSVTPAKEEQQKGSRKGERVTFRDVTEQAGLGGFRQTTGASGRYYYVESYGSGAAWLDYDGDGWLDLFVVDGGSLPGYTGPPPLGNRLYRNNRDGTFADVTERSELGRTPGYGMGCAVGDHDNDSDPDLYVTNFGPDVLYRNNGDGTFTDITKQVGIHNPLWGTSAAFADYDEDGDLDLYVGNYVEFGLEKNKVCVDRQGKVQDYCEPSTYPGVSSVLYRNDHGVFTDVTKQAGMHNPAGKTLGVVWVDYDNDGDLDLYVANDGVANFLYQNRGDGTFTDVGVVTGTAYSESGVAEAGMGTDAGDYDNDGDLDICVMNFAFEKNTLYRNNLRRSEGSTPGNFTDVSFLCGIGQPTILKLTFGAGFFDYDNDGDLDLFMANGHVLAHVEEVSDAVKRAQTNQLFENVGDGRFEDVSAKAGDGLKVELVSRGAAFGDYDNDGDVDILVTNDGDRLTLLRNEHGNRQHWLAIRVVGTRSHWDGIGTRITVMAGGRRQTREVKYGYSYLSSNDPRVYFGLGVQETVDLVEVRWPSGRVETLKDIPADRFITIREESGGSIR
jgi:tetratricopeptide (TPR) repeat protein